MTPPKKPKERGDEEGTVWKEDGVWRWQITLGYKTDGKRSTRSGRATSKKSAHDDMNKVQSDYSRGLIGEPDRITVEDFAAHWLRRQYDVTARTSKKYGQELEYALKHIGDRRLQDVRLHHLENVVAILAARKMRNNKRMSRSTLGRTLTRLRSLFREAVADRIIYVNPMEGEDAQNQRE
ncbi:hypothetical protein ACI3L1_16830 [Deinococcus sp. SM5_A1]|uniref:hypothetical protein n=1 Tax=Deinococcus sp. SM5_A1 TaxID=3379094 RepID=UPI00385C859A